MSGHDPGRRHFISGTAATAGMVATGVGAPVPAAGVLEEWSDAGAAVLVHDPRLATPAELLRGFESRGTRTIALSGDPVWFWRSAAGAQLREPSNQLLGVTGWADLLVFRGLAAETRRHLRYEKLAASGIFIWLIA